MPAYTWEDKNSGRRIDIIRTFSEYTVPPTEEESGIKPEDAKWERIIMGAPTVNKPWNWGKKGTW